MPDRVADGPGRTAPTSDPANGSRWVPLACLLVTGALLGVTTNVAKLAGDAGLAPLALLAWSVLGATGLLGLGAAWRRNRSS